MLAPYSLHIRKKLTKKIAIRSYTLDNRCHDFDTAAEIQLQRDRKRFKLHEVRTKIDFIALTRTS